MIHMLISVELITQTQAWHMDDHEWSQLFQRAVSTTLRHLENSQETVPTQAGEMAILLTDDDQIQQLNAQFRNNDKPTNVLSFPSEETDLPLPGEVFQYGDIILARGVACQEATDKNIPLKHHVIHLVVHGFLHLLGYDHIQPEEAEKMENLEREILAKLAIPDPYKE